MRSRWRCHDYRQAACQCFHHFDSCAISVLPVRSFQLFPTLRPGRTKVQCRLRSVLEDLLLLQLQLTCRTRAHALARTHGRSCIIHVSLTRVQGPTCAWRRLDASAVDRRLGGQRLQFQIRLQACMFERSGKAVKITIPLDCVAFVVGACTCTLERCNGRVSCLCLCL